MSSSSSILAFNTKVSKKSQLSPNMIRLTLQDESLRNFGAGARGRTLDLRIKVMIPNEGTQLPDLASLIETSSTSWYQTWLGLDPNTRGLMRTYTVRERRPESAEIDIDFVVHEDGSGESGPACAWAREVQVGDPATVLGPNAAVGPCQGIEFHPGSANRLLLAGDETALPAIAAILEELHDAESLTTENSGQTHSEHVFIEVPTSEDILSLDTPASTVVTWLPRDGAAHGQLLVEAVKTECKAGRDVTAGELAEVDIENETLWETGWKEGYKRTPTEFYAWIAGEAGAVKEMRRHLVRDVGVDRRSVAFMGYWREGRAERS